MSRSKRKSFPSFSACSAEHKLLAHLPTMRAPCSGGMEWPNATVMFEAPVPRCSAGLPMNLPTTGARVFKPSETLTIGTAPSRASSKMDAPQTAPNPPPRLPAAHFGRDEVAQTRRCLVHVARQRRGLQMSHLATTRVGPRCKPLQTSGRRSVHADTQVHNSRACKRTAGPISENCEFTSPVALPRVLCSR
jgi:hypothetical protein